MNRENHKRWQVLQVTSIVVPSRFVFTVNSGTTTAKLYLCLLILLSSIFTGCFDDPVQSLNPFYTHEALVEFPQLEGEWLSFFVFEDDVVLQMNIKPWIFEDSTIKIFDEIGKSLSLRPSFFR